MIENKEDIKEIYEEYMDLPLIPLRGLTVFPNVVINFDVGRSKSVKALEKAMVMEQRVFLVTQKDASTELPTSEEFYHVGTIGKIKQMLKLPGDLVRILVEGEARGQIEEIISDEPFFKCRVRSIDNVSQPDSEDMDAQEIRLTALMRTLIDSFGTYADLNPSIPDEAPAAITSLENPALMADIIASHLDVKVEDKQRILEAFDIEERLNALIEILGREIQIITLEEAINSKVRGRLSKHQREYYLREQLRTIQEELGGDYYDEADEVDKWRKAMDDKSVPEKVRKTVEKEIKKLSAAQQGSAEAAVIRSYIENIVELPWNCFSDTNDDLHLAEKILNEDHYGLKKVKERILEYLAVIKLSNAIKGPILCLVGPPGVGKTSIAKSIARATNREFVRMSLGGVRDEAEIRGHRRTYIGAIPGRVMHGIKDADSSNPVFLLDEVDKIGNDFRGDPASALLEVLDPEQNKEFVDHYLEVPFDLSKVLFITTANSLDTIPLPLLDRMEVIEVPSYTEEEKVKIAQQYLIPKKIEEHGLKKKNVKFTVPAVHDIINYYTREPGVRSLEQEIANICRKLVRKTVQDGEREFSVGVKQVEEYLGKKHYHYDKIEGKNAIGVTTGLAWTAVGGVTLFIEAIVVPGNGKLVLTGQLGDVMQESAKAGVSYIRTIAAELGIEEDFYEKYDIHIHIPEGATPKDGPSAGVTMCTALISALGRKAVRRDVAMTGEITLRGKVLPVGGIREKVMAAHRAGIKTVLLPRENERDIEDIPENVRKKLNFILLDEVKDALKQALI